MISRNITTELKVGIFTAAALATLAASTFVLEGNPFAPKSDEFYTVLDNVGGVAARTGVRVAGVQIGEVSSVELLPKGARVNFKIDPKVRIPKGSYIELRSRGILGDVYLEIQRTDGSTEFMASGDMIPKITEQNDFGALMDSMGKIAKNIQDVSQTLALVLGNEEGKTSLRNIMRNIEQFTNDARDVLASERKNVSVAIQGIRDIAQRVSVILERNDGRIDRVLESIDSASGDFKLIAAELRGAVSGPNKGRIESIIASLDESLRDVKQTASKVRLVVDKVERGEGSLGALVSKDETINELNSTLRGVQEFLRPATQLKLELDYKGEYRGKTAGESIGSTGNHFNLRMSTRPDRYYLLGLSDSPTSRKITNRTTTTTVEGANTISTEREEIPENRDRIRFNAQFAKRFENVALRVGFFESYAGLAGDLYMFSDKVTASVEVFNFKSNKDDKYERGMARVKGYANVFFTPNLYATGGVDQINNSGAKKDTEGFVPKPFPFVGAGLRFTDDDLRAVIGAAALAK